MVPVLDESMVRVKSFNGLKRKIKLCNTVKDHGYVLSERVGLNVLPEL